jgi:hypothetical protein
MHWENSYKRLLQVCDNGWKHMRQTAPKGCFERTQPCKDRKGKASQMGIEKPAPNKEDVSFECFKDWCKIGQVLQTAEELSIAAMQHQHSRLSKNLQLTIAKGPTSNM